MIESFKLLVSKLDDMLNLISKGRDCVFSNFLSEDELIFSNNYLKNKHKYVVSFGGYPDAFRKMLCVYQADLDYEPYFPLVPIYFETRDDFPISHRDVLGALTSLGIKREHIGDIVFFDSLCVFFVTDKICDFVLQNLSTVKRLGVSPKEFFGEIEYKHSFVEIDHTVSSLRLDCIVASIASVSRTTAEELILSGFVILNGQQCTKKDKLINIDDVISVRKTGKFKIALSGGLTKKGRIKIKVLKYN